MTIVASNGALEALTSGPNYRISAAPSAVRYYAGFTLQYEVIYKTQHNVRTVVDFLARNYAQLKQKTYRRVSDVERRHETHAIEQILDRPNPHAWRAAFREHKMGDLSVFGVSIAVKLQSPKARRMLVARIPPQICYPIGSSKLWADGVGVMTNGGNLELAPEQVFLWKRYNPEDPRWGISPLETLRRILAEDAASGSYREQFWNNAARMSGVISRPHEAPPWSDEARTRFRSDWQSLYTGTGSDAGATAILEEGMTFERMTLTAQEAEYLGARQLTREEVAAAFHIPPASVGVMNNANIANVTENRKGLYQDTLAPWCDWDDDETLRMFASDFPNDVDGLYLETNLEEKLRGSFLDQAEAVSRYVGAPILTRDEGRAMFNRPPLPNDEGAGIITPLNVLIGGRANPSDAAPGTPGAGQASRRPFGRKSLAGDLAEGLALLDAWRGRHAQAFAEYAGDQRSVILPALADGAVASELLKADGPWDLELTDRLFGLAITAVPELAAPTAERFGIDFNADVTHAWLRRNAQIAASDFNAATLEDLDTVIAELMHDPALLDHPAGGSLLARVEAQERLTGVFDAAAHQRAQIAAEDRAGILLNFAKHDAAKQAGARSKTWHTTSKDPRPSHAAIGGETVPLESVFSNGGRFPHDPYLPQDERAGCRCVVEFHR